MYYRFLIEKFGHPEYIGISYLATALEMYDRLTDRNIMELYRKVGEKHNCTPAAVERSVRMYILDAISGCYSKDKLGELINYTFKENEHLTARYLIPIIRFAIDNYFNEA